MNVVDELIHTTVRIECLKKNGDQTSGTGFICAFGQDIGLTIPAIVTNRHVIENADVGFFHMTTTIDENVSPHFGHHVEVPVPHFESLCVKHPNPDIDLAIFPIAPVNRGIRQQGKETFYRSVPKTLWADESFYNELVAIEDVVMIGYPNGLWDAKNNLPIVRRGITATPPYLDFEGKPEFMIDCACYPGSSGSPIFLVNFGGHTKKAGEYTIGPSRVKLLGILWGTALHTTRGSVVQTPVPTAIGQIAISQVPNNLGYCVKATELRAFDEHFEALAKAEKEANRVVDNVPPTSTPPASPQS